MNNLFIYLAEVNLSILIFYVAYRLLFETDRNFLSRRIYLLGILFMPFVLPLIPHSVITAINSLALVPFSLQEITVNASLANGPLETTLSPFRIVTILYLAVLVAGLVRLMAQLFRLANAARRSERMVIKGKRVISSKRLHASSFFGFIFIDPAALGEPSIDHILDHELVHKKEWHSIDRILTEIFLVINWFNPAAWMFRRSVIENLEYLADSKVVGYGNDSARYQLSLLDQYLVSFSPTNQFNSQIKNRINMLNKNYHIGSPWKLALALPLVFLAMVAVSCSEKKPDADQKEAVEVNRIYTEADEMPLFQGEDFIVPFSQYIAQNLVYPSLAKENGVEGKIFVTFVVRRDGSVEIPTAGEIALKDGTSVDEVVVVGYRPVKEGSPAPKEEYIELLKQEAIRVITSSPKWQPGKVNGKAVDIAFTMPISFVLQ